jgi:hypothetical protein
MTFQGFIQPYEQAQDVEALFERLGRSVKSGYRALMDVNALLGQNRIFDRIVKKLEALDLNYEDQCSSQYYFDLVRTLRDLNGQFDRVVEVGVYMGGASSILTGCIEPFDYDLDLVDIGEDYLRFAYERLRRMYPESAKRVRLFHGDLASYVRHVMLEEPNRSYVVHHDGSHRFDQVVKDMASLYYARQSILAIIAQDTHLRGPISKLGFVDLALYAVFGTDLKFAPIGAVHHEGSPLTRPNQYEGGYFMPGVAEGVVLPMAANRFQYPHPALSIDDFLPPALELPAAQAA